MREPQSPCPPAMCGFKPTCADVHCPGRRAARELTAADMAVGQRAMHTENGGTWVTSGHRVLRLRADSTTAAPSPAPPTVERTAATWLRVLRHLFP